MKTIAVFSKKIKPNHLSTVLSLLEKLDKLNCIIYIYKELYDSIQKEKELSSHYKIFDKHNDIKECSFLISIGGDGTLLDTITFIRDSQIPVIGFNIGKLGFLANTNLDDIDQTLAHILKGDYLLDKRSLIKVEGKNLPPMDINYALNEICIQKSDSSSMIRINTYIDDIFLNTYWADGIIIATPTGSTAYSLSCGGPIITPNSKTFIITPIASHNLTVRPIVIPDNSKIRIEVNTNNKPYIISFDSRKIKLNKKLDIQIIKEDFDFNLIALKHFNFFSTIRNKLLWGIDKRN